MSLMNNKKAIVILVLIMIISGLGITFAYFTDSFDLSNVFRTKPFSTSVTEEFTSPDNWLPGTKTNKRVYATNNGDVLVAVRISYTEAWVNGNNQPISLVQRQVVDGNDIDVRAALINFSSDASMKWTKSTENGIDYYYYKTKLAKGESTSSLIDNVEFNENIKSSLNCSDSDITNSGNDVVGLKRECLSSNNGYDGATYTLTINVETIQYDSYKEAWGTDVVIN